MDRPVALVQLREAAALEWAKKHGVEGDFDTLLKLPELNRAVMDDMEKEFGVKLVYMIRGSPQYNSLVE